MVWVFFFSSLSSLLFLRKICNWTFESEAFIVHIQINLLNITLLSVSLLYSGSEDVSHCLFSTYIQWYTEITFVHYQHCVLTCCLWHRWVPGLKTAPFFNTQNFLSNKNSHSNILRKLSLLTIDNNVKDLPHYTVQRGWYLKTFFRLKKCKLLARSKLHSSYSMRTLRLCI